MSKLTSEEKQVLYLIEKDADQAKFFFARAKNLKWFHILKDSDYFAPKNIKYNDQGYALFWPVLDYLEKVSEQMSRNPEYGKPLIEVIDNLVLYSKNEKKIINYHIWWYCVKIINNLPAKSIKDHLSIEMFRSWLSVWTEHSDGADLTIGDIGEKLMPKFYDQEYGPAYEYGETIVDVITEIKASGKLSPITNRQEAELRWDAYWIGETFKKHSSIIGQRCGLSTIIGLADRLKRTFECKQRNHYVDIKVIDDIYRIRVSRMVPDGSGKNDVVFVENQYECFVGQYSKDQLDKLNEVEKQNTFWVFHKIDPEIKIKTFTFSSANKSEMVVAIKLNLPKEIKWVTDETYERRLNAIFEGLHSDYSSIWIKSLAEDELFPSSDAEQILTIALRDVMLAKCQSSKSEGFQLLDNFLSKKYKFPIYKRLVLFCINKYWDSYRDYFDKSFDSIESSLQGAECEVELHDIFQNHHQSFSPQLVKKILIFIDDVPGYYVEKGERLVAYWKYKWLSPLRENPAFCSLYEEAKAKAEPEENKPYEPDRIRLKGGPIIHRSPISKEDLLQKPNGELVKYLRDYEGADFWHGTFKGLPDRDGLGETLQAAVKEDPNKFTHEILDFMEVDYFYLVKILGGIRDAWSDQREIDWKKVLEFSIAYLSRDAEVIIKEAIEGQGEDGGEGKHLWIIEIITDLISDACRDDGRALDEQYFIITEEVFNRIIPLLKGEKQPDTQRDAMTYALNTTLGRTTRSYLMYSLRAARVATKKGEKRNENWGENHFDQFFLIGIDPFIWFGAFLPQMTYLDEKYTKNKVEQFANKSQDDYEWKMFMEGYLRGVQQITYGLMRDNYEKAILCNVLEEDEDRSLVQHICRGYLSGLDVLAEKNPDGKDSLFWMLLLKAGSLGRENRWVEVAKFFWSLTPRTLREEEGISREGPSEIFKAKIIEFWAWAYIHRENTVKSNAKEEQSSFWGQMADLTILLENINEEKKDWLLFCVPHIDSRHEALFFIEYLTKYDDYESIKWIGKIFIKVLEKHTPTFHNEHIVLLVERIYQKGDPRDADEICNTYGRRGRDFLKDIWEKYQRKNV